MTSDERDRLVRLETEMVALKLDLTELKIDMKKLVAAANMAGGGWLVAMKFGGMIVILLGFVGWLYDHTVGRPPL